MHVVIAGGHGQIARRLARLLVEQGDQVTGLIRNPDHAADVADDGASPVVLDLETAEDEAVDAALVDAHADAVVFAAGAGPGSGASRKNTMDLGGAVKLADAALRTDTRRYVMISAIGADDAPDDDDEVFSVYLRAKRDADAFVRAAGLEHTIVRPGGLTDEPGTGRVAVGAHVEPGQISRDDVAAVLAGVLHDPLTAHRTFELVAGDMPIQAAIDHIATELDPD
jgi:nucleoside-diphosphate-sugar epimerase